MVAASARVAMWVSVAKVVLGFSVHLPPLSEAIQTELKTSSVSTAGNSSCWHIILIFFHYTITTLSLNYYYIIHYIINGVLFHFECLFHCSIFAAGRLPAAGCVAGIPSIVPRPSPGPRGDSPLLLGVEVLRLVLKPIYSCQTR